MPYRIASECRTELTGISDQLDGGGGNDRYVIIVGEETNTIITDSSGMDRLVLPTGIFPSSLRARTVGGDSIVEFAGGESVKITGGAGGSVIEMFEFSDGRIISLPSPAALNQNPANRAISGEILFKSGFEPELYITPIEVASNFGDRLVGSNNNDVIDGLGGKDLIYGGLSDDQLFGGDDNDWLDGNDGADTLQGGNGDDRFTGGEGADTLQGGPGKDWLMGGNGNDSLQGNADADELDGGSGIDTLDGGAGSDRYVVQWEEDLPVAALMSTITDADNGNSLRLPDGTSLSEVRKVLSGSDLIIEFGNSKIKIIDGNARPVIDKFEFFDRDLPAGINDLPSVRATGSSNPQAAIMIQPHPCVETCMGSLSGFDGVELSCALMWAILS